MLDIQHGNKVKHLIVVTFQNCNKLVISNSFGADFSLFLWEVLIYYLTLSQLKHHSCSLLFISPFLFYSVLCLTLYPSPLLLSDSQEHLAVCKCPSDRGCSPGPLVLLTVRDLDFRVKYPAEGTTEAFRSKASVTLFNYPPSQYHPRSQAFVFDRL